MNINDDYLPVGSGYTFPNPIFEFTTDSPPGFAIQYDFYKLPKIDAILNAYQAKLIDQTFLQGVGIVALRALGVLVFTLLAVVDILFWTVRTIAVVPMLTRGCEQHLNDLVSAFAIPILLLGTPFGYPPLVKPPTLRDGAIQLSNAIYGRRLDDIERIVKKFGKEIMHINASKYFGYVHLNYLPSIEKLLQLGMDINHRDKMGNTFLDRAFEHTSKKENGLEFLQYFLKKGADIRQAWFAKSMNKMLAETTTFKSYQDKPLSITFAERYAKHTRVSADSTRWHSERLLKYQGLLKLFASMNAFPESGDCFMEEIRPWVDELKAALVPTDGTLPQPATLNRLFDTVVPRAKNYQEALAKEFKEFFSLYPDFKTKIRPSLPLDRPVSLEIANDIHRILSQNMEGFYQFHAELESLRHHMIAWRELQKMNNPQAPVPFVPLSEVPSKCEEVRAWQKQRISDVTPLVPDLANLVVQYL